MMRPLLVVCLFVMAVSAQDRAADEWRKLQGAWTVTAGEQNGRPNDAIKSGTLTIADRAFTLRTAAGNEFTGELRINVAATPLQLDFIHANGAVWEGIYSVTGDAFRLNYVEAGARSARPKIFATSADTAGSIVVMRRTAP